MQSGRGNLISISALLPFGIVEASASLPTGIEIVFVDFDFYKIARLSTVIFAINRFLYFLACFVPLIIRIFAPKYRK